MRISVHFENHKGWLVTSETEQNQLVVADGLNRRDYSENFVMIDIYSEIRQNIKDVLKIEILKSGKNRNSCGMDLKSIRNMITKNTYFANPADSTIYGDLLRVILLSKN